jgi:hypothetical protein
MATQIQVQLPDELMALAQRHIDDGWATGFDDLLADALRRFLESHGPALIEAFVREDVEWGLHGKD